MGLLVCVLVLLGRGPAQAESRIALVIGNSGYTVAPLANPKNDAEAMAKSLKSVGFDVTKLIDIDQKGMRRAVVEFGRKLRNSDSVGLFYYAGHGVQVDGANFLVPVGSDIRDEQEVAVEGVNLEEILKTMERASSRMNIVVLDACRNNPFEGMARSGSRGLAPVSAPAGTFIAFATAPGQVALDGTGDNSPYSAALAQAIPSTGIVLEEVFRKTRRQVLAATGNRQTPWEHSSLTGEFYFKPKTAQPEESRRTVALDGLDDAELAEILAWDRVKSLNDAALFKQHMARYPNGIFADVARVKLEQATTRVSETGAGSVAGWIGTVLGASRGDPEAERLLEAAVKLDTVGTPESQVEAFKLYMAAAERGLPPAMHQLARAYDKGRGVDKSLIEAAVWYRRAADFGHPPSMASLGTMLEHGDGAPIDLAEALRLYRTAAEAGEPNAMTSLGYLYHQGRGVGRDGVEARKWYGRAVAQDNPRAMYNLALMHVRGEGGERDFGEAVRLLKKAIEKGHAGAMRELAFLFDEGRGVGRDAKAAADYLLASYKAGHRDARVDLLGRPEALSSATRREIQKLLTAAGVYHGRVTGYFDPVTRRAIEAYAGA